MTWNPNSNAAPTQQQEAFGSMANPPAQQLSDGRTISGIGTVNGRIFVTQVPTGLSFEQRTAPGIVAAAKAYFAAIVKARAAGHALLKGDKKGISPELKAEVDAAIAASNGELTVELIARGMLGPCVGRTALTEYGAITLTGGVQRTARSTYLVFSFGTVATMAPIPEPVGVIVGGVALQTAETSFVLTDPTLVAEITAMINAAPGPVAAPARGRGYRAGIGG